MHMNLYLSNTNLQKKLFFLVTTDLNFDSVARKKNPLNISNIIVYSLQGRTWSLYSGANSCHNRKYIKNVSYIIEATAALIFISCFYVVYYNQLLSFWPSYLLCSLAAVFSVTPEFLSYFYYLASLNVNFFGKKSEQAKI